MTKEEFRNLLQKSTKLCKKFASNYLYNKLNGKIKYFVYPNNSFDGNPLIEDEEVFPEDEIKGNQKYLEMTESEVVDFLWRNGKVPEWIDISPIIDKGEFTIYRLLCCGRYTEKDELIYYTKQGTGPFSVKSPNLPNGWKEEQGKFWL